MTADRDVARADATRLTTERDAARAELSTSTQALQSSQAELVELLLRALATGGSSSQPGSTIAAAQLAAELCTVQRLRASVAGSSVRVDTLLNRAELDVVETEGTFYSAVEEVFGTHQTNETRLAALYEAVSSSVRSLVESVQSVWSSRGTKLDRDE